MSAPRYMLAKLFIVSKIILGFIVFEPLEKNLFIHLVHITEIIILSSYCQRKLTYM